MKRIKSFKIFENFDLGREEIIDFFEDFDLVEIKSVEIKSVSDFTEEYKKGIKLVSYYIKDLFSDASYKTGKLDHILGRSNEQMMVVSLDFYHPKMIRNSSFQYENYIRETLKSRLQRVRDGYDMDVFMYIEGGDPIAKVQLFIFNQE